MAADVDFSAKNEVEVAGRFAFAEDEAGFFGDSFCPVLGKPEVLFGSKAVEDGDSLEGGDDLGCGGAQGRGDGEEVGGRRSKGGRHVVYSTACECGKDKRRFPSNMTNEGQRRSAEGNGMACGLVVANVRLFVTVGDEHLPGGVGGGLGGEGTHADVELAVFRRRHGGGEALASKDAG